MQQAARRDVDLKELFFKMVADLGASRQEIALRHQSKDREFFGIRRDQTESFEGPFAITPLGFPYSEYNRKLIPMIQKNLSGMKRSLRSFEQISLDIPVEPALGRQASMKLSIITAETVSMHITDPSYENYLKLCSLADVVPMKEPLTGRHYGSLVINKDAIFKLKQGSLDDYRKIKNMVNLIYLRKKYPDLRESDWIEVTVRLEVDGKMFAISQYLTWAYRDFERDPVEQMSKDSIVTVIHQDAFLIEPMLQDMARIFEQAIRWKKEEGLQTLKERVMLLTYEFHHAMPFKRGGGAIGEWIEQILYGYHGFKVAYNHDQMPAFEALTSPLCDFVKNYDKMIHLEEM